MFGLYVLRDIIEWWERHKDVVLLGAATVAGLAFLFYRYPGVRPYWPVLLLLPAGVLVAAFVRMLQADARDQRLRAAVAAWLQDRPELPPLPPEAGLVAHLCSLAGVPAGQAADFAAVVAAALAEAGAPRFARAWEAAHPELLDGAPGRRAHLEAFVQDYGGDLGLGPYLHSYLEQRYPLGLDWGLAAQEFREVAERRARTQAVRELWTGRRENDVRP